VTHNLPLFKFGQVGFVVVVIVPVTALAGVIVTEAESRQPFESVT
jgi:hypothetical protein